MQPVARIQFWFKDRDGNKGAIQWYVPSSLSFESLLASASAIAIPRLKALVDSEFDHMLVQWESSPGATATPGATSNARRKALLIFSNEDNELDAMTIISPAESIYEVTGIYAGMRVERAALDDLVNMLESLDWRTKDDRPFGTVFVAGSLAY